MARKATGTVQWSGDHWRARVTLADGSRPWLDLPSSIGADEREKARAKAAELAAYVREHGYQRADGGELVGDNETVREYAARWIAARVAAGVRTASEDGARLEAHVFSIIGDRPMKRVDARELRAVVTALDTKVNEGVFAWRTARRVWAVCSKMFADAVRSKREELRVREDNPALSVAPPDRGVKRAKSYLYPSEFMALVSSERVPLRFRRIYALAVYTYCRAGELEALRWCDVDLEHSKLLVHTAAGRKGERRETKGKNHREPPIEERLLPLLRAMRAEADSDEAPVIRLPKREDGGRLLRKHLQRAGVTRAALFVARDDRTRCALTFHDLRATGITWAAIRGDRPFAIQRRAGHSDLRTTEVYIRDAESAGGAFGEVFPALPDELCRPSKREGGARSVSSNESSDDEDEPRRNPANHSAVHTHLLCVYVSNACADRSRPQPLSL